MIYGLYLSATGVLTNSYRQDVIANNLANSETVGFKRDLALFQQRQTEAQQRRLLTANATDPLMENLGGGIFASPTEVDRSQGEIEPTGNPMDVAIDGQGYFAVHSGKETRLTRDGRFMLDRNGQLILSSDKTQQVLDVDRKPIYLDQRSPVFIGKDGQITQNGKPVARLGVFDVPDAKSLAKVGGNLMSCPDPGQLRAATPILHSEFVERANVDTASELATLMDTQRQLEANANMIRYQDQTLSKLVNEVGKIS